MFTNQKAFNTDHHRFAKTVFSETAAGSPTFDSTTCETFFKTTYSDEFRDITYQPLNGMPRPPPPHTRFKTGPPSWSEFSKMLKKRSNGSAPGPNGIPYLVYKKIPFCARGNHTVLSRVIKSGVIPKCVGIAYISLIPKDPTQLNEISSFRPIACLNIEGTMFLVNPCQPCNGVLTR